MKIRFILLLVLFVCTYSFFALAEDSTKIIQKVEGSGGDSSVLIETKKNVRIQPDYEIVSGDEELSGDPLVGQSESYKSWKEACAEWKKELKENNKDGQVLISSCGSPLLSKDEVSGAGSGVFVYRSKARYKLKVRITDKTTDKTKVSDKQ